MYFTSGLVLVLATLGIFYYLSAVQEDRMLAHVVFALGFVICSEVLTTSYAPAGSVIAVNLMVLAAMISLVRRFREG